MYQVCQHKIRQYQLFLYCSITVLVTTSIMMKLGRIDFYTLYLDTGTSPSDRQSKNQCYKPYADS